MKIEMPTIRDLARVWGMISDRQTLVGPKVAMVDIINQCDLHCVMCHYHSSLLSKRPDYQTWAMGQMSCELFASLLQDLSQLGTEFVTLCGAGEPFLHADINKMFALMAKYRFKSQIISNGIHINRDILDDLIKIRLERLTLSIHAADSKTYQVIHPLSKEDAFEFLKDNLMYLKQRKAYLKSRYPKLSIINVISSLNCYNLIDMAEFAYSVGAQRIWFKPLSIAEETMEMLSLKEEDVSRIRADLKFLRPKIKLEHNIDEFFNSLMHPNGKISNHNQWVKNRFCYIPWVLVNISTEGKVIGCVYQGQDFIGDINRKSFREIWNSKGYIEFRRNKLCPANCLGEAVYPFANIINGIILKNA